MKDAIFSKLKSIQNQNTSKIFTPGVCLPLVQKEKGYTSLQDEAVKIFNSLQEMEAVSDPVPIIQGILQTCQDLRSLRDEVYCQLIKQTNHVPHPNSAANRAHWHLLTCMSCTFLPSRGILRYLKFHLKRCAESFSPPTTDTPKSASSS